MLLGGPPEGQQPLADLSRLLVRRRERTLRLHQPIALSPSSLSLSLSLPLRERYSLRPRPCLPPVPSISHPSPSHLIRLPPHPSHRINTPPHPIPARSPPSSSPPIPSTLHLTPFPSISPLRRSLCRRALKAEETEEWIGITSPQELRALIESLRTEGEREYCLHKVLQPPFRHIVTSLPPCSPLPLPPRHLLPFLHPLASATSSPPSPLTPSHRPPRRPLSTPAPPPPHQLPTSRQTSAHWLLFPMQG